MYTDCSAFLVWFDILHWVNNCLFSDCLVFYATIRTSVQTHWEKSSILRYDFSKKSWSNQSYIYIYICMCVCVCVFVCEKVLVVQSCPTLCNPMICSPPDSLSIWFFRQEYQSGLPLPSPGDLHDPRMEPYQYLLIFIFFLRIFPGFFCVTAAVCIGFSSGIAVVLGLLLCKFPC